jgi:predicted Zn-dependent peptidase
LGPARLFLPAAAFGLAALAAGQDVPVQKYTLPNGLIVILREDHKVPMVAVNTWYHVGSKDEPPHHSGFAHLFEHLMFMGTFRVPTGQFDQIMEGGGGDNNASTAEDRTNFYDQGPSNLLPTLLWLEADRLEDLGNAITQKKLNLQRDVVKNERRQNTENSPYGSAYEAINGLMFPPGHPYHTSVIGSMADLDRASVSDVQKFFSTYYVPNNASLVVAGDFNPAKIKPLIAKLYGTLPKRPDVPRKPVPELQPMGIKRVTMHDKVEAPKIVMVWHSPAAYQSGDAEIKLAASVLADGLSSRLFQRLVVHDQIATDVSANQEDRLLGSLFYIDVTGVKGADLGKIELAIDDELQKFRTSGPTKDELKRQAAKLESSQLNGLQAIPDVADQLNAYEFYTGNPNGFKKELDQVRAATTAAVQAVAAKTLDPSNRLILTVLPGDSVTPPPTEDAGDAPVPTAQSPAPDVISPPDRARSPRDQRPAVGKAAPFRAPDPVVLHLKNGMKLEYWQRKDLPLMTLDLDFNRGADQDPPAKSGLASLTASLLSQGAGNLGAKEFSNALDLLGASFSSYAGRNSATASLNVLARGFPASLALYADAVRRPHFAETEFGRAKRVTIASIEQSLDDVDTVAREVGMRRYFGLANPVAWPTAGTVATVKKITRAEVVAEWQQNYRPRFGAFFAAGSLPAKTVLAELDKQFGNWRVAGRASRPVVPIRNPKKIAGANGPRVYVVDKPGAPQTAIRFMSYAPTYSDPRRLQYNELGTILGGTFTSRLNENLREDKGYTYGAGCAFAMTLKTGYFAASAQVRADVTGESIEEFIKEFERLRKGDVSNAEVVKAVASSRSGNVSGLATIQGLTTLAEQLASLGRPFSGLAQDDLALNGITAQKLNRLAKDAMTYRSGVLVLVGDKASILKQIAHRNLPMPLVVSAE